MECDEEEPLDFFPWLSREVVDSTLDCDRCDDRGTGKGTAEITVGRVDAVDETDGLRLISTW